MKRIALVAAAMAALATVSATAADLALNVQAAYYIPNWAGFDADGFAPPEYSVKEGNDAPDAKRDLGSTWGGAEAKAAVSISQKFPFLVGSGPLMEGNNLRLKGAAEFSPVSFNAVGQVSLTPIAFLVFDAGTSLGTGWTAGPFRGLGINPEGNGESDIDLTPFGGLVYRIWGAGTFQFDLAAVVPGDWNHVVMVASAKVEHKAYTGAGSKEAWLWEADSGENFNGAKLAMTYVLGYQMPLMVNMVGIIADSEEWLGDVRDYSTMKDGWGSDFRTWQVGTLTNFKLGEKDSLAVLVQFKRVRDYTEETTRNRDFRTRLYDDAYWYFNRVAFSYTRTF